MDLALSACRNRQSPRTGFVHYFSANDAARDTIPIFENFCFALALIRQRTAETVLEGKELLERLLAFQTPEGNFPIYLHDYPRCWDRFLPLRIAPVLIHLLRDFSQGLGPIVEKMALALEKLLICVEKFRPLSPLWEMRYGACRGKIEAGFSPQTAQEWFEWLISAQLVEKKPLVEIPYSKELQAFLGEHNFQERGEPQPTPIEWLLAEQEGFGQRLFKDHPHQMYAALLFPVDLKEQSHPPLLPRKEGGFRLLWGGTKLHSLFLPWGKLERNCVLFEFEELIEEEIAIYCDLSSETTISIEGKKGTLFSLGNTVQIQTPRAQIDLRWNLLEGEGDFVGHLSRESRPGQVCNKEAYDWKIGIRTLRRSERCTLVLEINYTGCNSDSRLSEELSTASPMACMPLST